jgi:hypothetical protein
MTNVATIVMDAKFISDVPLLEGNYDVTDMWDWWHLAG